MTVAELTAKWSASGAAERANKDSFLIEICNQLGVRGPELSKGSHGCVATSLGKAEVVRSTSEPLGGEPSASRRRDPPHT